jgi:antitoxin component of MazEF toxin-antitoxin module
LKVVKKPYRNEYVPGFNIQGKYLEAFGFHKGDMVEVLVSENRILIEKIVDRID